jgi:hypothetical protein
MLSHEAALLSQPPGDLALLVAGGQPLLDEQRHFHRRPVGPVQVLDHLVVAGQLGVDPGRDLGQSGKRRGPVAPLAIVDDVLVWRGRVGAQRDRLQHDGYGNG